MDIATIIRYKTTRDVELLPDDVLGDLIDINTANGEVNINLAIADVYDYLASGSPEAGTLSRWTRGPVSVELQTSYRSLADYYRTLGGTGRIGIEMGVLSRADYSDSQAEAEFSV